MNRTIKFMLLAAAALLTTASAKAEPDKSTQVIFKTLMAATVSNNYDGFIAECDSSLQAAITKRMLQRVSKELEPRARQGYEAEYLGELNQNGYQVHLWRLRFKDGGDDALATLGVKDGKAGKFLLQ
ncbi:MAG TPA: hypothetical protein VGM73_04780 [Candidatus Didemnitutus sp.]|jgi:hypothetical protein